MGRQWNQIIESLGPLTGGTVSINANLGDIDALLTTLQADVADGIEVTSGTVTANLDYNNFAGALSSYVDTVTNHGAFPVEIAYQPSVTIDSGTVNVSDLASSIWLEGSEPNNAKYVLTGGMESGSIVRPFAVDSSGIQITKGTQSITSGTITTGSVSITSGTISPATSISGGTGPTTFTSTTYGTIAAENTNRKGLTIYNEGSGNLHVTLGTATTSTSSYTIKIIPTAYYEVPYNYTGLIGGIFATAGTARVTQLT